MRLSQAVPPWQSELARHGSCAPWDRARDAVSCLRARARHVTHGTRRMRRSGHKDSRRFTGDGAWSASTRVQFHPRSKFPAEARKSKSAIPLLLAPPVFLANDNVVYHGRRACHVASMSPKFRRLKIVGSLRQLSPTCCVGITAGRLSVAQRAQPEQQSISRISVALRSRRMTR
jgi:hypothetical protein